MNEEGQEKEFVKLFWKIISSKYTSAVILVLSFLIWYSFSEKIGYNKGYIDGKIDGKKETDYFYKIFIQRRCPEIKNFDVVSSIDCTFKVCNNNKTDCDCFGGIEHYE